MENIYRNEFVRFVPGLEICTALPRPKWGNLQWLIYTKKKVVEKMILFVSDTNDEQRDLLTSYMGSFLDTSPVLYVHG